PAKAGIQVWVPAFAGTSGKYSSNRPLNPPLYRDSSAFSRWGRAMAWRERGKRTDAEGIDLRLRAGDRIGGPPRSDAGRRPAGAPRQTRKVRRGGKRRSGIGRLIYWGG